MANYYCEYCGTKRTSVSSLTCQPCTQHPSGNNKGNHKLYEGSEKSQYFCKFCGTKRPSISSMAIQSCPRHPNGNNKGKHSPAL